MDIISRNIDLSKYHTFFLEYYKNFPDWHSHHHLVRPSVATYDEIADTSKDRVYTLEGAVVSFDRGETISQILLECATLGISIDFIEIRVPAEKSISSWADDKVFQIIDTHKEDPSLYFDSVDTCQYYVTPNRRKSDMLKFLVVDRFSQDAKTDFLHGKYDKNAVIAGFKSRKDAIEHCEKMNSSCVH